jgi:hypothetical protein
MSQQYINVGGSANDGTGTPIRTAFQYVNSNFNQLFAIANPEPPITSLGKTGDSPGMYAYDSTYFYYCFASYNGVNPIWCKITGTPF